MARMARAAKKTARADSFTHLRGPGCFACDPKHRSGLRLRFKADRDGPAGSVRAKTRVTGEFGGPPGLVHGGVIATLLDEAMTKVTAHLGVFALTGGLEVSFLRPLPLDSTVEVFARPVSREGRVLEHESWLADRAGTVIARGRARFVEPRPETKEKIVESLLAATRKR